MKKRKTNRPNPMDCRWLDRYFGNVCRNPKNPSRILAGGVMLFVEPPCQPCRSCGFQPITPKTPAWDDPGDEGVPG
jgi:hypothetical protein